VIISCLAADREDLKMICFQSCNNNFQIDSFSNFQIELMNKVSNYFRESYKELTEKVTWPTWAQLQQSTLIVLSATIIIMAMVWLMDLGSNQLLKLIYSFFT
jgi:preprotein translocase subunit SecE